MPTLLCPFEALPDGAARGFDPQGRGRDSLFVVRRGDELRAYLNACPHIAGATMAWRKDAYLSADGQFIVCHAHGARFDITTGHCVLGPCQGQALTPVALQRLPDGGVAMADHTSTETSP